MDCSTPGLPVRHQLLEFTQTHVHRAGDAIQPSHPLSSPSPPGLQSFPEGFCKGPNPTSFIPGVPMIPKSNAEYHLSAQGILCELTSPQGVPTGQSNSPLVY
ncbi:unnamed protein product [Rangifer tarandus platyrhynchus]|uniref:Uncharacterized protein n=2 Tax=Rangifer tarandus platyrhynchus TaxID=3082113 RepID=A0AC59ZDU0_RANTA|nr:unnamed protein product [Rangifer tarandus platyrhynchus]